jgi:UDP-N-acetylglucosamine 1-carboxyvinyltransferase
MQRALIFTCSKRCIENLRTKIPKKRANHLVIYLPRGCSIGMRNIDFHVEGLTALGAIIHMKNGYIIAEKKGRLIGTDINFRFLSVGATHHIIIAACLAEGMTVIRNAAKEPEVIDLANFLNSMGADIKGAGTSLIKIKGVEKLFRTTYSIMPDRINAGTYMVASAITGGNILIQNAHLHHLKSFVDKLREIGVEIIETNEGIRVIAPDNIKPVDIITEGYPGFATDLQPIITPLLAIADGKSIIRENIFDKRFNHIPELIKMGADIKINEQTAVVIGVSKLIGSQVVALDLRAGASLLLAGLVARGKTEIKNAYQIDRGYENIEDVLRGVGANIERRIVR